MFEGEIEEREVVREREIRERENQIGRFVRSIVDLKANLPKSKVCGNST